jgi:hypothetical protein
MNSTKRRHLCEQVRRFRSRFVHSVERTLGDVLPVDLLVQWITEEVGHYRERVYGPLSTLMRFVEQVLSADQSCRNAVADEASARMARGESMCSLNSGPYCKARARLPLGLLERLGREVSMRLCANEPAVWRWRNRAVKLVDGTTVSMPDTTANQASFPQNHEQKAGLGFPLARVVAIVSLSCGAVLEWAVGACEGKKTGETALLWQLASRLSARDVVIADRCYAGYFMIVLLKGLGVDVVIRQHQLRRTDFRCGKRLGKRDHVVSWARPQRPKWMDKETYASMPELLTLREVRAGGWTLVTTLLADDEVSKQELLELYRLRWQVELDLRSIKAVMQMDVLRCQSPEMVMKEIAVHLLAYNLVRAVMAQAADLANVLPRQLSFKGALQVLNAFEQNLRDCSRRQICVRHTQVLLGIAQMKLPYRPGRVEPRAIKRRPTQHKLLTKPRHIIKERLLKLQKRQMAAFLR